MSTLAEEVQIQITTPVANRKWSFVFTMEQKERIINIQFSEYLEQGIHRFSEHFVTYSYPFATKCCETFAMLLKFKEIVFFVKRNLSF